MKYSSNLPKRSYQTDIGSFSITDFFSYYKFSFDNATKIKKETDDKTTLVEAAGKIYNDSNSFWLILMANKTINPFLLFSQNSTVFIENNKEKNTSIFQNQSSTIPYNISAGSIITPFANTGGNPYDYNYVGNFDVNGDVFIVESQNFYNKRITVKPGTDGLAATFLSPNGTTLYKYLDPAPEIAIETVIENSSAGNVELYLNTKYQITTAVEQLILEVPGGELSLSPEPVPSAPTSNTENSTYTVEDIINYGNKFINIFDSISISSVTGNLTVIKYS